jgi:cyclophilin family peptidyl-prolyl cis-trans isomerase/HEAT repeat protein
MMRVLSGRYALLCLGMLLPGLAGPAIAQDSLRVRMLRAEDSRAQAEADLRVLRQGLTHADPALRAQAVRAIGRLERAELIRDLTPPLADSNANVRMEAANAIGQLARGAQGVDAARSRLLARAKVEQDASVWGVIAATLGRLPYSNANDVEQVEAAIASVLPGPASTAIQIDAVLGAVEGLEALARISGKIARLKGTTLDGLRAASALEGRPQDAAKLARIRRLATLALTASGAVTRPGLEAGAADADDEVRRLTMVAARAPIEGNEAVVAKGLADANPRVRYEALQTWSRLFLKTSCDAALKAVSDPNPHVSLLAIDLLGNGCPVTDAVTSRLRELSERLERTTTAWHAPAHAFVALAKISAADGNRLLFTYRAHPLWQVRMYAARAAGALGAIADLERLGRDEDDNVREAALSELIAMKRPEARALALEAVSTRSDYQLLLTAVRALADPPDTAFAATALAMSLARIEEKRHDTSRDARAAIAERLTALGKATPVPQVAESALAAARTSKLQMTDAELDSLARSRLRFTMAGRGVFEMRLLPDVAPVTAMHVARLAREGYYNGLTFHRVVPNFVIQGGSPGANEYAGQGPFMRDEVGLVSHTRGTVGISTRGRDTGDAQIFINLVDLPRLDHTYTVFAEVVSGMDVVDAIVEGDVIERVELLAR